MRDILGFVHMKPRTLDLYHICHVLRYIHNILAAQWGEYVTLQSFAHYLIFWLIDCTNARGSITEKFIARISNHGVNSYILQLYRPLYNHIRIYPLNS